MRTPPAPPASRFAAAPTARTPPYAAGGGLDLITRALAQKLTALWGKQVVVENRPGAGSTIGTAAVAKGAKDGYTLLVASTPLGVAPAVYANLPYDARRDFAPLALVAGTPEVLVVSTALGARGRRSRCRARSSRGSRRRCAIRSCAPRWRRWAGISSGSMRRTSRRSWTRSCRSWGAAAKAAGGKAD
ncbi:MAG: hypothetical protein EPO20_24580 [Betaproteobacteria bacterium]|nr:MAG: hypothetical protein EPO20_24580 [Betaproteobacteria bacterium]